MSGFLTLNAGAAANDDSGDSLRAACLKINDNLHTTVRVLASVSDLGLEIAASGYFRIVAENNTGGLFVAYEGGTVDNVTHYASATVGWTWKSLNLRFALDQSFESFTQFLEASDTSTVTTPNGVTVDSFAKYQKFVADEIAAIDVDGKLDTDFSNAVLGSITDAMLSTELQEAFQQGFDLSLFNGEWNPVTDVVTRNGVNVGTLPIDQDPYWTSGDRIVMDGSGDAVDITNVSMASDFEITLYAKSAGWTKGLIGRADSSGDWVRVRDSGERLEFSIDGDSSNNINLDEALPTDRSVKIEIIRASGVVSVKIDDVTQAETFTKTGTFTIGRIGGRNITDFFTGSIWGVNINDAAAYDGYGNLAADWVDTIGSNDGSITGSPTEAAYSGTENYWYVANTAGTAAASSYASGTFAVGDVLVNTTPNGYVKRPISYIAPPDASISRAKIDAAFESDIDDLETGFAAVEAEVDAFTDSNKTIVTIATSDKITIHGDSYTANTYGVKGKGWVEKVKNRCDWVLESAFAQGGHTYQNQMRAIFANATNTGSIAFKNIQARFSILHCWTNDMKVESFEEWQQDIRNIVQAVLMQGSIPIIMAEYHQSWSWAKVVMLKRIAEEFKIPMFNTLHDSLYLRNDGTNSDYSPFWGGTHPGTRTNELIAGPTSYLINQLPRPMRGLKVFRLRSDTVVLTTDDLRYTTINERRKLFNEIMSGHTYLTDQEDYDALSGSDFTTQDSEYMSLQSDNNVSLTEYALVEFILPKIGQTMSAGKLSLLSDDTVTAYALDRKASSYSPASLADYAGFYTSTDPGVTAGDVYRDSDGLTDYTVVEVFQDTVRGLEAVNNWDERMSASASSETTADGTLTKQSGNAGSPGTINYTRRQYSFPAYWYSNYGKPQGHWSALSGGVEGGNLRVFFNDVDQYISFTAITLSSDFELTINVRFSGAIGFDTLFGYSNTEHSVRVSSRNKLVFKVNNSASTALNLDETLVDGVDYEIVIIRASNVISATVNGVAQTATVTLSGDLIIDRFGARNSAADPLGGYIWGVNINDVAAWTGDSAVTWTDTIGSRTGTVNNGPLSTATLGQTAYFNVTDFDGLLIGDKLPFLLYCSGGFSAKNFQFEYSGGVEKYNYGYSPELIGFPKTETDEQLAQPLLDPASITDWTTTGTAIARASLVDAVVPVGTTGVVELTDGEYIEQAMPEVDTPRTPKEYLIEIWGRRWVPVYNPAGGFPGSAPINNDSFDDGEAELQITWDGRNITQSVFFGLHYQAARVKTLYPADIPGEDGVIKITSKSNALHIAKVSIKAVK